MKFCERAQFGAQSAKTSTLKKTEAVKRRKVKSGSKKVTVKGMNVKNNPFDKDFKNSKKIGTKPLSCISRF